MSNRLLVKLIIFGGEMMPVDPEILIQLEKGRKAGLLDCTQLSPIEARKEFKKGRKLLSELEIPIYKVEDKVVSIKKRDIPFRIYSPKGDGPFPILIYFHGGGWVLGDVDSVDSICRFLSREVNCVVVSVDYRLAPENKFPAAIEDAFDVTEWIFNNAPTLNGDATKIGIGGDSAGGNLAAVVALMGRDKSFSLCLQLLLYPVVKSDFTTDSYKRYGDGFGLTTAEMKWFWHHYVNNEKERKNPYISPIFADTLEHLPPAIIITAEYDPLRDEGEEYGVLLQKVGVPTFVKRYDGMVHSFFNMSEIIRVQDAMHETASKLSELFQKA